MYLVLSPYCQGKPSPSAAAMPHNFVSRSPLKEGKYICQDGLIVPHCLSICTSAASVWGSHKVISIVRYISIAVDNSARACSRWLMAAYSAPRPSNRLSMTWGFPTIS